MNIPKHTDIIVRKIMIMETNKTMDERAEHYYATLTRPLAVEQGLVVTAYVIGCMDQQRIERIIANQQLAEKGKRIEQLERDYDFIEAENRNMEDRLRTNPDTDYETQLIEKDKEIRMRMDSENEWIAKVIKKDKIIQALKDAMIKGDDLYDSQLFEGQEVPKRVKEIASLKDALRKAHEFLQYSQQFTGIKEIEKLLK